MQTVFQQYVHKQLAEMLKNKYHANSKAAERVAAVLYTRDDVEQFLNMASDLYRSGFERAAESYKEQLKKLGYEIKITHANDGV